MRRAAKNSISTPGALSDFVQFKFNEAERLYIWKRLVEVHCKGKVLPRELPPVGLVNTSWISWCDVLQDDDFISEFYPIAQSPNRSGCIQFKSQIELYTLSRLEEDIRSNTTCGTWFDVWNLDAQRWESKSTAWFVFKEFWCELFDEVKNGVAGQLHVVLTEEAAGIFLDHRTDFHFYLSQRTEEFMEIKEKYTKVYRKEFRRSNGPGVQLLNKLLKEEKAQYRIRYRMGNTRLTGARA